MLPRRMIRHLLAVALSAFIAFSAHAQGFKRTEDVIYGRKFGMNLTLDVIQPDKPNGYGVLWMVSGGFYSSHEGVNPAAYKPLLERGYTVFAVVHGSQPKYTIPEIETDIHRAVRFVRHNAEKYGIKADQLGITGGSAGGHLTLTMATQGGPGKTDSKDPVERESSVVQAAACFYPPTDFLNWGKAGEDAVGFGPTIKHQGAFGPQSFTAEGREKLGREISPINYVSSKMAPTLVVHGDADAVVPIYQAQVFQKKCEEAKAPFKLIVKPGADHGWSGMDKEVTVFADWFDEYLRGIKK